MTTLSPLSRLFGLCALVFTTAFVAKAQDASVFDAPADAKSILDSYGSFEKAVLGMTRPEWEVVRAWKGFDNDRYLQFLHDYHDSFEGERAARKEMRLQKVLENDACGCWVEPDETYTTMVPPATGIGGLEPGEMAWSNQGGAGWNVDCSSEPIPVSPNANPWQFTRYFRGVTSKGFWDMVFYAHVGCLCGAAYMNVCWLLKAMDISVFSANYTTDDPAMYSTTTWLEPSA